MCIFLCSKMKFTYGKEDVSMQKVNEILKIGYFADGPWAHRALDKLLKDRNVKICFICVRDDHKDPVLIQKGKEQDIDVLWTHNINETDFVNKLKEYAPDLFVSMSFNQIFRQEIINLPKWKTINCHAGKLPYYRGRNILNWALINDEKEFGITVHYVDEGIDTGDIILQRSYPITDEDDYKTLLECAYVGCADVLCDAIQLIYTGKAERIKQETIDPVGMYCGMRIAGDECMNWNQDSRDVFNFVRAICLPGPQAISSCQGETVLINKVRMFPEMRSYKGIPGQIIGKTESGWIVKTADTAVEIVEFTTNAKLHVGSRLK